MKYSEKSSSRHLTTSVASLWLNEGPGTLLEASYAFFKVSSSTRGRLRGLSSVTTGSHEVLCGSDIFDKVWVSSFDFWIAS